MCRQTLTIHGEAERIEHVFDTDFVPEELVSRRPVFIETADGGFVLSVEDQAFLYPDPPRRTLADRLVSLRAELTSLAHDLPAAARAMEPHDLLDAVEVLQQATNLIGSCDQAVVAEIDRQGVHESPGRPRPLRCSVIICGSARRKRCGG